MRNLKTLKLVLAALMAAFCCIFTIVIPIPSPMNGYANPGDCMVLIAGWVLGPVYGGAAAGVGSALADILCGYAHYAPGTLVIKGLMAVIVFIVSRAFVKKTVIGRLVGALCAEMWMVMSYFFYACLLLGRGLAAAASIPGNMVQGVVGIILGFVLIQLIRTNPACRKTIDML